MFVNPTTHRKLNIDMFTEWRAEVSHHASHYAQHLGLLALLEIYIYISKEIGGRLKTYYQNSLITK
jgi:hypothetical protein